MWLTFCMNKALSLPALGSRRVPAIWTLASLSMSSTGTNPEPLQRYSSKQKELSPGTFVRRIIPQVKCRSVGPFVFLDHFGPTFSSMDVGPHPHIGLCTLTYLYEGGVLHRDSTGVEQPILPNEVNWMCSGKGITHSERPIPSKGTDNTAMHGLQLWVALPKDYEDVDPQFHHSPTIERIKFLETDPDVKIKLVVGSAWGYHQTNIPLFPGLSGVFLVSAEFTDKTSITLPPLGNEEVQVGIYVSDGAARINDDENQLDVGEMVVIDGASSITIDNLNPDTKIAILGGEPFPESRHLLWNFCSFDREKLKRAADAWMELDRAVFPPVVNESNEDSIPLRKK